MCEFLKFQSSRISHLFIYYISLIYKKSTIHSREYENLRKRDSMMMLIIAFRLPLCCSSLLLKFFRFFLHSKENEIKLMMSVVFVSLRSNMYKRDVGYVCKLKWKRRKINKIFFQFNCNKMQTRSRKKEMCH